MKLRFVAERGKVRFEIIEDSDGFYVYRYEEGRSTHDYHQKDLPMAYRCAEQEWNVPSSAWRPAAEGELLCELQAPRLNSDSPRITFGDRVRVLAAPETEAQGVAGLVGQVYGYTRPSVTGGEVIGELRADYAINVSFESLGKTIWFSPDLLEFVDHAPGTEIKLKGAATKWVRSAAGEWIKEKLAPKEKPWWRFW